MAARCPWGAELRPKSGGVQKRLTLAQRRLVLRNCGIQVQEATYQGWGSSALPFQIRLASFRTMQSAPHRPTRRGSKNLGKI